MPSSSAEKNDAEPTRRTGTPTVHSHVERGNEDKNSGQARAYPCFRTGLRAYPTLEVVVGILGIEIGVFEADVGLHVEIGIGLKDRLGVAGLRRPIIGGIADREF